MLETNNENMKKVKIVIIGLLFCMGCEENPEEFEDIIESQTSEQCQLLSQDEVRTVTVTNPDGVLGTTKVSVSPNQVEYQYNESGRLAISIQTCGDHKDTYAYDRDEEGKLITKTYLRANGEHGSYLLYTWEEGLIKIQRNGVPGEDSFSETVCHFENGQLVREDSFLDGELWFVVFQEWDNGNIVRRREAVPVEGSSELDYAPFEVIYEYDDHINNDIEGINSLPDYRVISNNNVVKIVTRLFDENGDVKEELFRDYTYEYNEFDQVTFFYSETTKQLDENSKEIVKDEVFYTYCAE